MKYDFVFEGGGAKGMAFVGAYAEFLARGHTIDRLLGTSAGAIAGTLIAAGYTPREMFDALNEKKDGKSVFAGFLGEPTPFTKDEVKKSAIRDLLSNINLKFVPGFLEDPMDYALAQWLAKSTRSRHFFAFVERGGWFAADLFVAWLQIKLDTGLLKGKQRNFSNMTLSEFFHETHVDLSVVASDTTDSRLLVLNHHTAPNCPVVWAVRMSMSIPLLWDEVIWKEAWGNYLGYPMQGHSIVDGGLLSNFPIELFVSDEPHVIELMGPKKNSPVLGLLIDESLPVKSAKKGILVDVNIKLEELKTLQRFRRLLDTMIGAHDKMIIEQLEHLVVRLPAAGYSTTEFDMSDSRRDALVKAGREAMSAYLESHPAKKHAVPKGTNAKGVRSVKSHADRIALSLLGLRKRTQESGTKSEFF